MFARRILFYLAQHRTAASSAVNGASHQSKSVGSLREQRRAAAWRPLCRVGASRRYSAAEREDEQKKGQSKIRKVAGFANEEAHLSPQKSRPLTHRLLVVSEGETASPTSKRTAHVNCDSYATACRTWVFYETETKNLFVLSTLKRGEKTKRQ